MPQSSPQNPNPQGTKTASPTNCDMHAISNTKTTCCYPPPLPLTCCARTILSPELGFSEGLKVNAFPGNPREASPCAPSRSHDCLPAASPVSLRPLSAQRCSVRSCDFSALKNVQPLGKALVLFSQRPLRREVESVRRSHDRV